MMNMQLPAKSTGSSPWGHVTVVVFILTQGDAQQQRTLCVALTGAATSPQGGDREKLWVSWVYPAVDQGRLTDSLELKLPLFVETAGVPPVSWVWLPNLRQPKVSHFSGRTNSEIPEHRLCEVGPWRNNTHNVLWETHTGGCKCTLWACLALELPSHYGFCFRLCALLLLRKILFCWWAQ